MLVLVLDIVPALRRVLGAIGAHCGRIGGHDKYEGEMGVVGRGCVLFGLCRWEGVAYINNLCLTGLRRPGLAR